MDHKPECTTTWCYCGDQRGDPMCECGMPGWACICDRESLQQAPARKPRTAWDWIRDDPDPT